MSGHTSQSVTIRMRFVTPAFLGGADQSAELRAAPFKALLRQCWRIAKAPELQFKHERLREEEGLLFGHTWLATQTTTHDERQKTWHMKSPLSISVTLKPGSKLQLMDRWPEDPKIKHPEVNFPVGAHLYLGYGPLDYDRNSKGTVLKDSRKAIKPGTQIWLRLSGRKLKDMESTLKAVLSVMHWTGAIGGRSRNGWGSLQIIEVQGFGFSPSDPVSDLSDLAREYEKCLEMLWPHAVGTDAHGLLCWRTKKTDFPSWEKALEELARIKISVRTHDHFQFQGRSQGQFSNRHFLAYPVTNHSVTAWPREGRLANQMRFKVFQMNSGYVGAIFHLPAGLPSHLKTNVGNVVEAERAAWKQVHKILDKEAARWK